MIVCLIMVLEIHEQLLICWNAMDHSVNMLPGYAVLASGRAMVSGNCKTRNSAQRVVAASRPSANSLNSNVAGGFDAVNFVLVTKT